MANSKIIVACPKCGKKWKIGSTLIGKTGRCSCGNTFEVSENTIVQRQGDENLSAATGAEPTSKTPELQTAPGPQSEAAPQSEKAAANSPSSPAGVSRKDEQLDTDTSIVPNDQDEAIAALSEARKKIFSEIGKIIIGQVDVIDQVLTAFFARGHCVIEGVPGLAKTLMISSLAETMTLDFTRVQFTPDLMPTDITGTSLLAEDEHGRRQFTFSKGPVFTNILLADEINRTPPKTQAALLESMQERNVSVGGETYHLPEPFLVLATQNPIEQEGTYPLPEAQLDRFLFLVKIDYPSLDEEEKILLTTTLESLPKLSRIINGPSILDFQRVVRDVEVAPDIANYAARIPRATRPNSDDAPDFIKEWVRWGCGPRAGQALILAGKAHCALHGRPKVTFEDIRQFAYPILRHRIILNFAAVSEGHTTDDIITMLLEKIPETRQSAQPVSAGTA